MLRTCKMLIFQLQFPDKEVKDFEAQLLDIQETLHVETFSHEGKTAEQVYLEKLGSMSLTYGTEETAQDGRTIVRILLARCLLWAEIIQRK